MTTESSGPYLIAALLCEKVLQEKDDTISVIRIVDRLAVTVNALGSPETMQPTAVSLNALISLKSGSARGRGTVKWRVETPSGLKLPDQLLPVLFEGDDRGVNLIIDLNMVIDQEGVYWFDVILDEKLLTRIPLRILYQRIGQGGQTMMDKEDFC